ncbi:MAG: winged helix-turn-helix transcriptional regulator [Spirochaetes bacterium]|nr:winged helix-turn-helix transcriptional regulator [Spirochaetota bacterium]
MQHDKGEIGSIFKTLHILKRKLMKECGHDHERCDIHHSSARTLHFIIAHGSVTMSELHAFTGFERGSLTTIVDGLIELGLVERKRGEDDRRKVFVIPTPKGISADNEIHRDIERYVKRTLEKLSQKDRERFFNAMKTLEEIAEKL